MQVDVRQSDTRQIVRRCKAVPSHSPSNELGYKYEVRPTGHPDLMVAFDEVAGHEFVCRRIDGLLQEVSISEIVTALTGQKV